MKCAKKPIPGMFHLKSGRRVVPLVILFFLVTSHAGKCKAQDGVHEAGAGRWAESERELVFGVVPQFDARRLRMIWDPILGEITRKTGIPITFKGSSDIVSFERAFERGDFDVAYMNPYHLIVAHREQGYVPIVRDVGRYLKGIIVVRRDSPINSVAGLSGKVVAFPAPNALGAALIPRAEFDRKFNIRVFPRYVRSHTSVYLNVALKQTDAGGGVVKTFEQQAPEIRNALRILYHTTEIASHPVAVHPRVPEALRDMVRRAFLELGETRKGGELLVKIPVKRIGEAALDDYGALGAMNLEEYYIKE